MREAAEAIVDILAANAVAELFVMPGDAFPVLEAIAKHNATGRAAPRIVACPHEATALSAAHGHYMVSGRPQACLFHVDVGLQAAGGMLHNAQRGRAGVVILGGKTPMTFDGSLRGGRVIDLHWLQDRRDLASVTRDYVKWYYDLARTEALRHVLQRAFQIAAAEPAGPVYVALLRELLLEQVEDYEPLPPSRYAAPAPPGPDMAALEQIADLLARAEQPVAIAGHVGRNPAGFWGLTRFAEAIGLPVVVRPDRANLSTDSSFHLGTQAPDLLATADLILLLDVDVPYIPAFQSLRSDSTVVQIDIDPLKVDIPLWGFPVDVAVTADTAAALPALQALVEERRTAAQTRRVADRREMFAVAHDARRRAREVAAAAAGTAVSVEYLSLCVADLVDDETIVVDDSTTAKNVSAEYLPMRVPGSYFQPMGSSMGWGAGAAVGAKLAAPASTVIGLNAEGNFLSGEPLSALLTSARYEAPTLTVVYDNAQYAAIKFGMLHEYGEGYAARAGFEDLALPSSPDLAALARTCGAHAERVSERHEVRPALERALAAVRGGQPAVVDVVVTGP